MPEAVEIKLIVDDIISMLEEKSIKLMNVNSSEKYKNIVKLMEPYFGEFIGEPISHGKSIYIPIANKFIKIHLMLSGKITFKPYNNIFELELSCGTIGIQDKRNLTKIEIVDELPTVPDCINISEQQFVDIFSSKNNRQVHLVMSDQKVMAGIGKYLKSEILYHARQNPFDKIENVDLSNLYNSMKHILNEVMEAGGSIKYGGNYKYKIYGKNKEDGCIYEKNIYWVPEVQV